MSIRLRASLLNEAIFCEAKQSLRDLIFPALLCAVMVPWKWRLC